MTLIHTLEKILAIMEKRFEWNPSERMTWTKAMRIIRHEIENERLSPEIATSGSVSSNEAIFNKIVQERVDSIFNVLGLKAKEYATGGDRFHNFRVAARLNKTTPEKALKGMMLKHEVAVLDMINNPYTLSEEIIDEKIGDNINYLILLEGLLKERLQS